TFVERDNTLLFVVDPQVKYDYLQSFLGVSRALQPVINMGFSKFVQEFKALDTMTGTTKTAESEQ
ncbi:MAG: hypothetical protein Q7J06_00350, partial [Bacteroidales bacterium]|nr:hypothetical protein [Bacteroidales bacterium]